MNNVNNGTITLDEVKRTILDSEECKRTLKRRQFTSKYDMNKNFLGKGWIGQDDIWYSSMFMRRSTLHENFIDYFKRKTAKTVLEIGCGTGIYPIKHKELFLNVKYVGIDISESAISYCKDTSKFDFICGDFLKMDLNEKFDLVYSHGLIDHVYDIDLFFSKLINVCKKHAYISAYLGYFPNLKNHDMAYVENSGCYLNKLSVSQIKKTLLKNGLKKDEFSIRPHKKNLDAYEKNDEIGNPTEEYETIIEIERKK